MYKKTISYEDFNGEKRKGEFLFNYTQAELIEMRFNFGDNPEDLLNRLTNKTDGRTTMSIVKKFILGAYGERMAEGNRFIKKDPETGRPLSEIFESTAAYDALFTECCTNAEAFADFIKHVIPKDVAKNLDMTKVLPGA